MLSPGRKASRFNDPGILAALLLVVGCASPAPAPPSAAHLSAEANLGAPLPRLEPILHPALPPPPQARSGVETYSVIVNKVPVHDLLFALARDAGLSIDIHDGINGEITLSATNQTLIQLLNRIARQTEIRFEIEGTHLSIMPDTPFLRNYAVDYVNMSRETTGSLTVATQLVGAISGNAAPVSGSGNNSATRIENRTQHRFWETLIQNIKDILHETDRTFPGDPFPLSETAPLAAQPPLPQLTDTTRSNPRGSTPAKTNAPVTSPGAPPPQAVPPPIRRTVFREAASVIVHPETGTIGVRATARQHEKIREFIGRVQNSARRQVMIEATLVEVQLSNHYQQGIDWSHLATTVGTGLGLSLAGQVSSAPGLFTLSYRSSRNGFAGMVKLLDTFGTTRVLSSPKLSVLNNQTAVLKVVDNSVYFTIKADTTQNQTTTATTYTTTLNQVPVGFVMNVTPQISESETVLLNVRPSVSRIIGTVRDPNPALRRSSANAFDEDIISEIPIIRTREMESMLRIQNGNIAVMGGLMEDSLQNKDATVPAIGRLPLFGEAFTQRDDLASKTELVVFLRPTIIHEPGINGDYASLREYLPPSRFISPETPLTDRAVPPEKLRSHP